MLWNKLHRVSPNVGQCQDIGLASISQRVFWGLEDPNARPRRVRCSFENSHQRHEAALTRHADDQLLDLSADPRPSKASTGVRAIKFVGDELAVPSQNNGVWSGHIRHLGESLAA